MPNVRSVKTQTTKFLKKHGYKPSVPSNTRIKPKFGMRLMDQGFEYKNVPFKDNCFYLGYYPGAFSSRISDEQVQLKINGMLKVLQQSHLPAEFSLVEGKILIQLVIDNLV